MPPQTKIEIVAFSMIGALLLIDLLIKLFRKEDSRPLSQILMDCKSSIEKDDVFDIDQDLEDRVRDLEEKVRGLEREEKEESKEEPEEHVFWRASGKRHHEILMLMRNDPLYLNLIRAVEENQRIEREAEDKAREAQGNMKDAGVNINAEQFAALKYFHILQDMERRERESSLSLGIPKDLMSLKPGVIFRTQRP